MRFLRFNTTPLPLPIPNFRLWCAFPFSLIQGIFFGCVYGNNDKTNQMLPPSGHDDPWSQWWPCVWKDTGSDLLEVLCEPLLDAHAKKPWQTHRGRAASLHFEFAFVLHLSALSKHYIVLLMCLASFDQLGIFVARMLHAAR